MIFLAHFAYCLSFTDDGSALVVNFSDFRRFLLLQLLVGCWFSQELYDGWCIRFDQVIIAKSKPPLTTILGLSNTDS